MKAAWFDALVFDPRFGGQNCLSVVQTLQAEFGNLMAVRQNLCVQIGVCWLQRLIELAGKELVIFKFDFYCRGSTPPWSRARVDCGIQIKLKSQRPGHTGRKALATKKDFQI